jgi:hypothetical protein
MKRGPATIEITIATIPAIRTSTIGAPSGAAAELLGRQHQAMQGRREPR